MRVLLYHPFIDRIFCYKPSGYWGNPIYGSPQIGGSVLQGKFMGDVFGCPRLQTSQILPLQFCLVV